ncbi:hypothetical protein, partial [Bandra megavirus]
QDNKLDNESDNKLDNKLGNESDDKPDNKLDNESDNKLDNKLDNESDNKLDNKPDNNLDSESKIKSENESENNDPQNNFINEPEIQSINITNCTYDKFKQRFGSKGTVGFRPDCSNLDTTKDQNNSNILLNHLIIPQRMLMSSLFDKILEDLAEKKLID